MNDLSSTAPRKGIFANILLTVSWRRVKPSKKQVQMIMPVPDMFCQKSIQIVAEKIATSSHILGISKNGSIIARRVYKQLCMYTLPSIQCIKSSVISYALKVLTGNIKKVKSSSSFLMGKKDRPRLPAQIVPGIDDDAFGTIFCIVYPFRCISLHFTIATFQR
uniref:Uncharacterized protein n=1 Tax=Onchocerca volvulus TaxID=6282 RepID=A0A8R1U401_ONCVO